MTRKDGRGQILLYLKPEVIKVLKQTGREAKKHAYEIAEQILEKELLNQGKKDEALLHSAVANNEEWRSAIALSAPLEDTPRYRADIAGGALKIAEARIVAAVLLDNPTSAEWQRAIEVENVLQKRSIGTAKRQASLVRNRLDLMSADLWHIVRDGSKPEATHAIFACAIKQSPLLADFLHYTVRDAFRTYKQQLPRSTWERFLEKCQDRDPTMPVWAQSTRDKLGDSVFQVLHEVGYLSGSANTLRPIRIAPQVSAYLREHGERYVLSRIQVAP